MERRAHARRRERIPCEVVHGERRLRAILTDVSPAGAFLELESDVALGAEIEVWFADAHFAPQVARARVVRRRLGAALAFLRRGVGVAWSLPPACARERLPDELALVEVEVEIELGGEEPRQIAASEVPAGVDVPAASECEIGPLPAHASSAAPAPLDVLPAEAEARPEERALDLSPAAIRAEVVVIDEGELAELTALVSALGATAHRMRWGAQAEPAQWESLPRLVIASARVALAVPIEERARAAGVRGVAVCESPAHTLHAQLHRQGYELIVQRAAHRDTLRLFFGALLHRRPEQRREWRRAFGAPVRVTRGWRSLDATLLEVTSSGGSLVVARAMPRGTRVGVRIPAEYTGGRALALAARVERTAANGEGAILGLRFEPPHERERAQLAALIARLDAHGPLAAPSRAREGAEPRAPRRSERRRSERRPYAAEVLAIDPACGSVREVLFGTDLSLGGLRVEPHPGLARGERIRIALQAAGGEAPIVLDADVARDDGANGLVLKFVAAPESALIAIRRMLDAAGEIEQTGRARGEAGGRLVLGALLREQGAR